MDKMIQTIFWLLSAAFCVLTLTFIGVFVWAVYASKEGGMSAFLEIIRPQHDNIELAGLCWGGLLAGIIALYKRAVAAKSAATTADRNKIIEKSHIDEQIAQQSQNLGNAQPSVRIAAFNQLYRLATGTSDKNLIRGILNTLCAHLRHITGEADYRNGVGKEKPTDECQSLLNIIFLNPENVYEKNIFAGIYKDLRNTYLVGADLRFANADKASFCNAKLCRVMFNDAGLRGAHFAGANLEETQFIRAKMEKSKFVLPHYPRANIIAADFSYAELYGANLSSVDNGQATIGLSSALVDKTTKPPCGYYLFQTDDGDYWLREGSPPEE